VIECHLFRHLAFTEPKTAPLHHRIHHRKLQFPKMAPLCFCISGCELPWTKEPGLHKRPWPGSPSHSAFHDLRPLPSAPRTSSQDFYRPHHPRPSHLLIALSLPSSLTPSQRRSPSFFACYRRRPLCRPPTTAGAVRRFRLALHKTGPPQDR
jgi:hypothetical protein